jgi:PPP family 3-phenylpropionic acid transporter
MAHVPAIATPPWPAEIGTVTVPTRFAFAFGAQFAGFGAMMPFLPAILAEGGLGADEVGLVMAAGSLVRLLAAPLSGRIADSVPDVRRMLAVCALVGAAAAAGFGVAAGFALLLAVQTLHSAAAAPIIPLTDSQAVAAVRAGGFDYARVRAVGSITFILGAVAAGVLVEWGGPRVAAWMLAAALLLTASAALALPPPAPRVARGTSVSLWAPLREPGFRRILIVAALVQGSHAAYYAFSTLHWQAAGLSSALIGTLWGWGVVAEVILFLYGGRLADRLGVRGLAWLAAGSGLLRWTVTGFTTDLVPLFLVQGLHAATFGAMHLAAMRALVALPAEVSGRAQTLLASGVAASTGLFLWLSGPAYAAGGGLVFLGMALLCGVAAALATRLARR